MSTIISSQSINEYPKRADFLNKELSATLESDMMTGAPIEFMPNHWYELPFYRDYALYAIGVFRDGSRGCVHFDGIKPYILVELPSDTTETRFSQYVKQVIMEYRKTKWKSLYRCDKFQTKPSRWLKITFAKLKQRTNAIDQLKKEGLNIAADDPKYYFLALREYNINTAAWLNISMYSRISAPQDARQDMVYLSTHIKTVRKFKPANPPAYFDRDPTMVCSWDIETHYESASGLAPKAVDSGWTIDIICLSFFWHHSTQPLLEVCITNHAVEPHGDRQIGLIIICNTQADMIRAITRVWSGMQPDILLAYNGAGFDTPLTLELARKSEMMFSVDEALSVFRASGANALRNIESYHLAKNKRIKITSEKTETVETIMEFPGTIDIDAMVMMMKAHPKLEVNRRMGLNKYLEINGLESKEDMPYPLMREIFRRAKAFRKAPADCHCTALCELCVVHIPLLDGETPKPTNGCCRCVRWPVLRRQMFDVAYYCKIDCLRPQQLMVKRTVIPDRREIANLSRTDLCAAIYQADGIRVQNLMGKYSAKMNIAFKNGRVDKTKADKEHNPGAFVPKPKLGKHITVPIFAVDATSLYPSLIMNGNISADMLVTDPAEAQRLLAEGYDLRQFGPITYEKGEKKGMPNNIKLTKTGWFVRHGGRQENIICAYDKQSVDGVVERLWPRDDTPMGPSRHERGGFCDCPAQCGGHPRGEMPRIPMSAKQPTYTPVYGRRRLPGERMGLLPIVCSKLFDKRIPVKKLYTRLSDIAKEMTKSGEKTRVVDGREMTLADIIYLAAKYNAKQNAIKVLNNTVYGQSGYYMSATYEFLVAATITGSGQKTIKLVMDEIRALGGIVWYGDTDSAYNSAPIALFRSAYEKYAAALRPLGYNGPDDGSDWDFADGWAHQPIRPEHVDHRIRLWTELVTISMEYVPILCQRLCDLLIIENGTQYLQFAYEEVGMPFLLCGKKKYALTPHIDAAKIEFRPPKQITAVGTGIGIMVKGLDMVKQGMTPFVVKTGLDFVYEAMMPEDNEDLLDKVKRYVEMFMKSEMDPKKFTKTSTYKPNKKNVAVLRFVERMRQRQSAYPVDSVEYGLYAPPDPGDKIFTVVVANGSGYDARGLVIDDKIGERMEYLHVFEASQSWETPYKLDRLYYLEKSVLSLLTRFVRYVPEFQPKVYLAAYDTDYSKYDAAVGKLAIKYLLNYAKKFSGGVDKTAGVELKRVFREAKKSLRATVINQFGGAIDPDMFEMEDFARKFPEKVIASLTLPITQEHIALMYDKLVAKTTAQEIRQSFLGVKGYMGFTYRARCIALRNKILSQMQAEAGRRVSFAQQYHNSLDELSVQRRQDPNAVPTFVVSPDIVDGFRNIVNLGKIVASLNRAIDIVDMIGRHIRGAPPTVESMPLSVDIRRSFGEL